jgi:5,6-dimethylbenzimidazole synthase
MEFSREFRADLYRLFAWRRDVRQFRRGDLPPGTFERLMRIACLAPSVGLSEPWRFVTVDDAARRAAVRTCFARCNAAALALQPDERAGLYARLKLAGLDDAPCHFAVFADHAGPQGHGLGRATMPQTVEYSAVLALGTLWLAARAEGLGLGWVSILDPAEVARVLDVPASWRLIGYFCLGFPQAADEEPALQRAGWEHRGPPEGVLVRR